MTPPGKDLYKEGDSFLCIPGFRVSLRFDFLFYCFFS